MGDVITVFGDVDYDGFYRGELAGRRGLVPSNFLRPASAADASPRPRHPRGPTSPLPAVIDESRGLGLPETPYGQPPIVSPTPQQQRPGDLPQSTVPPPVTQIDSRDITTTSAAAYIGGPETVDEQLRRSGQTFRR